MFTGSVDKDQEILTYLFLSLTIPISHYHHIQSVLFHRTVNSLHRKRLKES